MNYHDSFGGTSMRTEQPWIKGQWLMSDWRVYYRISPTIPFPHGVKSRLRK